MHQHDLGRQIFYVSSGHVKAILKDLNGSWGFQYIYGNGMPGPVKFIRRSASEAMDAFFSHKAHPRRPRYLQHEAGPREMQKLMEQPMKLIPLHESFNKPLGDVIEIRVPKGTKVTVTYY